ncbi:cytochrome b/b6 domain-containing protein [Roseobacter sp. S98]|uniref:cytochrome b/b6 domain-containing protein n=1 Tax=Roseobacter algicola (ex Choi et al. 2025) (nom. illeg.) TaxID=3092138 RepID=UPI003F5163E9
MMYERETPVWDITTRVFHWSLVFAYCISQLTAEEWDTAHEYTGYIILGFVVFRIGWGFVGPRNARFSEFVTSPSTIKAHLTNALTGRHTAEAGHNPAGGVMVVVLLAWLALTGTTGWLSTVLSGNVAELFERSHEFLGTYSLLLIVLHVAGVVVMSLLERQNLARSMIDGKKHFNP